MKRRTFNLLAGTSLASAGFSGLAGKGAEAQAADAAQLQTTLNPMGGERAGNAAGTIPPWTGGMAEIPAGLTWDPSSQPVPDFWADEQPLYTVTPANMAQYSSLLSDGVQYLISKKGMSLKVYPSHRTAAVPQWVEQNVVDNVSRAKLDPAGGRFGFVDAYGGYPFPILDQSDPLVAGVQCIWNHETRWPGASFQTCGSATHVIIGGVVSLSQVSRAIFAFPYYLQDGNPATYTGYTYLVGGPGQFAPANVAGDQTIHYESSNTKVHPNITWQLLAGQGRVRKAPEVAFDTPSSYADGMCNYDEYYGFGGAAKEYDWKLLGKQEILVPYNNNKTFHVSHVDALGVDFVNPDVLRWELHRVWVVDATLHSGERNVLARRRLYFDEDTWLVLIVDAWDANGDIFRHSINTTAVLPNLPGTIYNNTFIYNLQTGTYVSLQATWGNAPFNELWTFNTLPMAGFNPQSMAAAANY